MIEVRLLPALLFCSGTLSLLLAWYTLTKRRSSLTHVFALFACGVAIYAFGYAMELLSQSLGEMLFWSKCQYVGISFLPGLILGIALCYTGRQAFFSKRHLAFVFAVPLVVLAARLTNPYHALFYRSASMIASDAGALLKIEPGPFYLLHAFYSNLAWVLSFALLIRFYLQTAIPYKRQTMVLIVGSAVQWLGYVVYLSGLGPDYLDINPLLLTFTVPVYTIGILRFSLFSLVPVAREKVFEEMRDGVVVVDQDARLVDFNRRSVQLFPKMTQKNIGVSITDLFDGYPEVPGLVARGRSKPSEEIEIRMEGRTGQVFFRVSYKPLYESGGRETGSILTFTDVTAQKRFMDKLERLATMDELTGIYNRRHLTKLGKIEIQRFSRSGLPLALLIMDLDHFKAINDTWGHHSGDRVLKAFAVSVKQNIRAMDIFGRFGGEEFMIIMPDTPGQKAVETAERICRLVENLSVAFDDRAIHFTVSIGVSGTLGRKDINLETVTQEADRALYIAKNRGRNQVVMADIPTPVN